MRRSTRFTRRERKKLNKELISALAAVDSSVKLVAAKTEHGLPTKICPTSPESIEHWFKYSYGSWKK